MTRLRSIICRLTKHKVKLPESGDIRCERCGLLLSAIAAPEMPTGPMHDRSYTNGCLGKTRFPSHAAAEQRMLRMKVRPATLHPYWCKHCRGVHLGNSRKNGRHS